jgi:predicted nucleotidyltransferase
MSALPTKIRDVVTRLEQGLKELYGERFRGLLLYGSYARGTAWEGSDVDLLLLLAGPVDPVTEIFRAQTIKAPLALEGDLTISIVPVNVEDFERGESIFLRVIRREAVRAA